MRTSIVIGMIGLAMLVGPATPAFSAAGETVTASLQNVKGTTLLMSRDGVFTNVIFGSSAAWFTVTDSTAADLPPAPFQFRVLNLQFPSDGTVLPTPVTDAVRHCAQVGTLVQLQPDKFSMTVRIDTSNATVVTFDPVSNWLTLGLHSPSGSFRCTLNSL